MEPVLRLNAMCVHVAVKQGQRAFRVALEAQTSEVAQEGSARQWIVACWGCAGCLTCLGAFNQVDVPPRDGIHQQTGHDALREDARTGLKQREEPPEPVGFEVIRGHHAKTRLGFGDVTLCDGGRHEERTGMPSTGLRGQGEQRHGLLFCFRPTAQRRVQFHACHGSSAQFDALQGDFRDRGTRFVKPRQSLGPFVIGQDRKPAALTEVDDVLHGLKPTTVLARTGVKTDLVDAVSDAPRPEPNHQESHLTPGGEHPRQGL